MNTTLNSLAPAGTEIVTARLQLRQLTMADAACVLRHFSDAEMLQWMDFGPLNGLGEAEGVVRWGQQLLAAGRGCLWGICLPGGGALAGTLNYVLRGPEGYRPHRAELTYDLARDYWGRGYMAEAVRATLPFAFDTLEVARVECALHVRNTRSAAMLLKCGFRPEGLLRQYGRLRGALCDVVLLALLREEWAQASRQTPRQPP